MGTRNIQCMMTDLPVGVAGDAGNLDEGDDRLLIVHRGVVIGAVHTSAVHGSKTIKLVVSREHPEQPFSAQQGQTIEYFR